VWLFDNQFYFSLKFLSLFLAIRMLKNIKSLGGRLTNELNHDIFYKRVYLILFRFDDEF